MICFTVLRNNIAISYSYPDNNFPKIKDTISDLQFKLCVCMCIARHFRGLETAKTETKNIRNDLKEGEYYVQNVLFY